MGFLDFWSPEAKAERQRRKEEWAEMNRRNMSTRDWEREQEQKAEAESWRREIEGVTPEAKKQRIMTGTVRLPIKFENRIEAKLSQATASKGLYYVYRRGFEGTCQNCGSMSGRKHGACPTCVKLFQKTHAQYTAELKRLRPDLEPEFTFEGG